MVGSAGEIRARYRLTGSPLGWHEAGLLCVEGATLQRVVLKEVEGL